MAEDARLLGAVLPAMLKPLLAQPNLRRAEGERGQIDKERHIGDPDFAPVPLEVFADPARHAAAAAAIRAGERVEVPVQCRLDSDEEVSIYEAGGVLQRFAQDFLAATQAA